MRILVIGATGFVGRRLVGHLRSKGELVHAVARRPDHGLPCPTTVLSNPLDGAAYRTVLEDNGIETVINLLAAGVEPSDRDAERLLTANATFPALLTVAAAQAGVKSFLHVGSSAEYAPYPEGAAIPETAPLEVTRLYGASKAAGSILVQAAGRSGDMRASVLRAFNIFGPGEKPHRLFPAVASKLSRHQPVDLSLGTQVRDFLYVDDACAAMGRMADAMAAGVAADGVYNLASGRPLSVAGFVSALAEAMGADPELLRFGALPMRPDDFPVVVAATGKLDSVIGPASTRDLRTAFAEGLRDLHLENGQ